MAVKVYVKGVTVFIEDKENTKRIPSAYSSYEVQRGFITINNLIDNTNKTFPAKELRNENGEKVGNADDYLSSFIGAFNL
jgi:hypothetical protein